MADQLHLEIVTPERVVLETDVDWVTVPGSEGELGVLPEHVPLMTSLHSGVLEYASGGKVSTVAVHYGYAQVQGSRVTVLSEMAEPADEIDKTRAQDAERRAREFLESMVNKQNEEEDRLNKIEAKLKRALIRQQAGK